MCAVILGTITLSKSTGNIIMHESHSESGEEGVRERWRRGEGRGGGEIERGRVQEGGGRERVEMQEYCL